MQINNLNSNQNFGMAIKIRPDAQKILAKKIKTDADIQILDSLVKNQETNPFKVDIRNVCGNLVTYISDTTPKSIVQLKVLKQGFFEKYFKSPVAFIRRCCKTADKLNEEIYAPNMDPKLKNIFKKTGNIS